MHDPTASNHWPDRKTIALRAATDAARIHREMLATVGDDDTYRALLALAASFRGIDDIDSGDRAREIISAHVRRMVTRVVDIELVSAAEKLARIDAICTAWRILST